MMQETAGITKSVSWSLDPILYGTLPVEQCKSLFADLYLVQFVFNGILILSLLYPAVHLFLQRYLKTYKQIESTRKKIVTLHHVVEILVLTTAFPFMSYWMIRINFRVLSLEEYLSSFSNLAKWSILIMAMYMMELASRISNLRPIVFFHHFLSCLNGSLIIMFPSTAMLKIAAVLSYFICFEIFTFVGLVMYRLYPSSKNTPAVILAGMGLFGVTRPLQILWVLAALVPSWNDENIIKWHAVLQIMVTVVLTILQTMTLKIHYAMWKRCKENQIITFQRKNSVQTLDTSEENQV